MHIHLGDSQNYLTQLFAIPNDWVADYLTAWTNDLLTDLPIG